jgi:hypothetical protein
MLFEGPKTHGPGGREDRGPWSLGRSTRDSGTYGERHGRPSRRVAPAAGIPPTSGVLPVSPSLTDCYRRRFIACPHARPAASRLGSFPVAARITNPRPSSAWLPAPRCLGARCPGHSPSRPARARVASRLVRALGPSTRHSPRKETGSHHPGPGDDAPGPAPSGPLKVARTGNRMGLSMSCWRRTR